MRTTEWRGFRACLTDPHDGDSFRVLTDGGFDTRGEPWLRLYDTSAPELAMRLPRFGQPGGRETTEFVNDWMTAAQAANPARRWYLSVQAYMTETVEPNERTTFRRYVASVYRYEDWPSPWRTTPPPWSRSLGAMVKLFLSGHPEWPSGE